MGWLVSLRLLAAEDVLSLVGLMMLMIAAFRGDRAARALNGIAVAALLIAAALSAPALASGAHGPAVSGFFGQYRADAFAAFAKLLIDLAAAATLLVAPGFFTRETTGGGASPGMMPAEYPLLVVFAAVGMGLMVSTTNLLTLYIGLELNSLAGYVLAAMLRGDGRSAEAGLKYFVLGALASGILLFGISLIYGFTGSIDFAGIRAGFSSAKPAAGALFGMVFMLSGLAFKISAVPFHMWTPDVYEGAPTPVTTFFASAPKVAALALLMRVALVAFGAEVHAWQAIVIVVALLSIVVGALGAIGQSNLKRLLAFSSINNIGFMLIGLAASTLAGAAAMLIYLSIYVLMSLAGFIAVLMLKDDAGNQLETIADIAGLSRRRPFLAGGLAMVMFSLAGIPPLFGFWGKLVVFRAAVAAGLLPLAVVGITASVIGAFYYIKIVKVMYFDESAKRIAGRFDATQAVLFTAMVLALSPLGYLATPWLGQMANSAAAALFGLG